MTYDAFLYIVPIAAGGGFLVAVLFWAWIYFFMDETR